MGFKPKQGEYGIRHLRRENLLSLRWGIVQQLQHLRNKAFGQDGGVAIYPAYKVKLLKSKPSKGL